MKTLMHNNNFGVFLLLILALIPPSRIEVQGLDLISTLLSQAPNLPGKLLPDIRKMLTPQLLRNLFPGVSNGTELSLESLRKDPAQLQRLFAKLKPMQSRFDPHLFELLSNAFKIPQQQSQSVPAQPQQHRIPHGHQQQLQLLNRLPPSGPPVPAHFPPPPQQQSVPAQYLSHRHLQPELERPIIIQEPPTPLKRDVTHKPPTPPFTSTTKKTPPTTTLYPQELKKVSPSRHDPNKFSSTFVQDWQTSGNKSPKSTTATTTFNQTTSTEIPSPFNHITDPNIKNHRLYQFTSNSNDKKKDRIEKRFENYTVIDRLDDLMMDETIGGGGGGVDESSSLALFPLGSESVELEKTNGGWIPKPGVGESENDELMDNDRPGRPRAPLLADEQDRDPEELLDSNYFRPSPVDELSSPEFFTPGQDFFTSTIRTSKDGKKEKIVSGSKKPFVMPHFPPQKDKRKVNEQQQQKLNYDQNFLNQFIHRHGAPASAPNPSTPASPYPAQNNPHRLPLYQQPHPQRFMNVPQQPQYGQNSHPFANPHRIGSPAQQYNKYYGNDLDGGAAAALAESELVQSLASDKNDSSWSSTFFLLGGLVAASALAAFILPSFLTTVTAAGKDNDIESTTGGSINNNKDFWNEIKGLYNDLRHLAKGDFSYFKQSDIDQESIKSTTRKTIHEIDEMEENENDENDSFASAKDKEIIVDDDEEDDKGSTVYEPMDMISATTTTTTEWSLQNPEFGESEEDSSTSQSSSASTEPEEILQVNNKTRSRNERRRGGNSQTGQDEHPVLIGPTNATFFINNTEFYRPNHVYGGGGVNSSTFLKEWARVQLKLIEH